jgi:hypothetical protein
MPGVQRKQFLRDIRAGRSPYQKVTTPSGTYLVGGASGMATLLTPTSTGGQVTKDGAEVAAAPKLGDPKDWAYRDFGVGGDKFKSYQKVYPAIKSLMKAENTPGLYADIYSSAEDKIAQMEAQKKRLATEYGGGKLSEGEARRMGVQSKQLWDETKVGIKSAEETAKYQEKLAGTKLMQDLWANQANEQVKMNTAALGMAGGTANIAAQTNLINAGLAFDARNSALERAHKLELAKIEADAKNKFGIKDAFSIVGAAVSAIGLLTGNPLGGLGLLSSSGSNNKTSNYQMALPENMEFNAPSLYSGANFNYF